MPAPRHLIACLTLLVTAPLAPIANAGCFDWLRGGQPTYAAQYAPVATSPAYTANLGPIPPMSTFRAQPALTNGAYQVQRPAYFDNPSVYTGRPVITARPVITGQPVITGSTFFSPGTTSTMGGPVQTSFSVPTTATFQPPSTNNEVPLANNLRGVSPAGSAATTMAYGSYESFYGNEIASGSSPGLPMTTVVPEGTPQSSLPAATITPIFPSPPPPPQSRCCLSRFFGSLLGTSYRSSYYRAPVTYYRPVTTVDPVTGTPISVQQPCTSYVQQLQRTPAGSLQAPSFASPSPSSCQTVAPPAGSCGDYGMAEPYGQPSSYGQPSTYGQPSSYGQPSTYGQPSAIGQVGGIETPSGSGVAPIPSTVPNYGGQPGYYGPAAGTSANPLSPNVAPLTGSPPSGGDQAPVDKPQLPAPPRESSYYDQPTTPPEPPESSTEPTTLPGLPKDSSPSYWESKEVEDATASLPRATFTPPTQPPTTKPLEDSRYTRLDPIPAPDHYQSPLRRQAPPFTSEASKTFDAPPLPPTVPNPADATNASTRISVPVREAALTRGRTSRPPTAPVVRQRDRSGWRTIQP